MLFRLVLFFLAIYLLISYISTKDSLVLGDQTTSPSVIPVVQYLNSAYQKLPPESRHTLENLPSSPVAVTVQQKISQVQVQLKDFPETQITEVKKIVVQKIYQDIMNSLNKK